MPKRNYKYLLFDLDHTLWDFERNSTETLDQLFYEFELDRSLNTTSVNFIQIYFRLNYQMWKEFETGNITKDELRFERFFQALKYFGYQSSETAMQLSSEYLRICPYKTSLIPRAKETLDTFHANPNLKMIIVTNGFAEIQSIKMKQSGLEKYFDHVISSETIGVKKPSGKIFHYAMNKIGGNRKESLMIGDSFHSDVIGARNFGIDQVYFNPAKNRHNQKPTYNISCISELLKIIV